MDSKLFSIGDIVTLKTHPYHNNLTDIIISGDHIMLPPLLVVIEVFKARQTVLGDTSPTESFKYKCVWFSAKPYRFVDATLFESDLKLILENTTCICKVNLKRGDKITLKSSALELGKKKSSLTYEDNSFNAGSGNTVINSLLSFLSPVMQVIDVKEHISKNPLVEKKSGKTIRIVHGWDVKFSLFDPTADKISEYSLPLEALELIEEVEDSTFKLLQKTIVNSGYLGVNFKEVKSLIKPRNIAARGGYYYLRAYDYLTNKVEEIEITGATTFLSIITPFEAQVPEFDIAHKPKSATPDYITNEIIAAVNNAEKNKAFIRIKYKNRNDQLSHRTLKNFKIITVKEDSMDVSYLVGFCLLRQSGRNFRIDRVQGFQELKLSYK